MTLLPNYYDFIRKHRPYVVELAEMDARDLLSSSAPPESIISVDDYESRFSQCIEHADQRILDSGVQQTGLSPEQVKQQIAVVLPQAQSYLSNFHNTVNIEYHCIVNFALAGKKTFHFSDNLSEHLLNTEINLKAGLIELPFPTCLFTFTSRTVINAMHNIRSDGGSLNINALSLDYSAPVSVFISMHPAGESLPGRKLIIVACHARASEKSYLTLKRELYLGESWTLEQALRTDWTTLSPDDLGAGMVTNVDADTIRLQKDDTFYTDGLLFYRFILNAVLYLSSDHAELAVKQSDRVEIEEKAKQIVSATKLRKAIQAANRYSELPYTEVGASVGVIVIQKGGAESTVQIGNGSRPQVRFMVRGHWRQQAHGQRNEERKLVWIRPFYKGPDMATLINKPYSVR
jgi:hypothetical protein